MVAILWKCFIKKSREYRQTKSERTKLVLWNSWKLPWRLRLFLFYSGAFQYFFETEHNPVSVRIFGAILSVAGTAIFIVAVWTMRDSWRAGVSKTDKTELVTNGIYQISRNPAFLGFDLLYIGTLLMFFNWILCFLTVFAVIMYHLQIVNVEEDFLFATLGNEYLQYKKKVCRYIGRKR